MPNRVPNEPVQTNTSAIRQINKVGAPKIETLAPMATIMVTTGPKMAVPASITGVSLPASAAKPTVSK